MRSRRRSGGRSGWRDRAGSWSRASASSGRGSRRSTRTRSRSRPHRRPRPAWKSPSREEVDPSRAPSASPAQAPRNAAISEQRQLAAGGATDQHVEGEVWKIPTSSARMGAGRSPSEYEVADSAGAARPSSGGADHRLGPADPAATQRRRRRRRARPPGRAPPPRPASSVSTIQRPPAGRLARRRRPDGRRDRASRGGGSGPRPGTGRRRPAHRPTNGDAARATRSVVSRSSRRPSVDRVRQRVDPADVARRAAARRPRPRRWPTV